MGRYNTILLKSDNLGDGYEEGRVESADIMPGMLIEKEAGGTLSPHDTAGGRAANWIAIEDGLIGKTVDTAYVADGLVRYMKVAPNGVYAVLLKDGENAVIGSELTSAGDGTFKVANGTTDVVLFKADEALDLSGVSNTTNKLIKAIAVAGL